MVSATIVVQLNSSGSCSGQGRRVVFSGETLCSPSASLHPGLKICYIEFYAGDKPVMD